MIDRLVILNDLSIAKGGATALALLSAGLLRDRNIPVTLLAGDAGCNPELAARGVEIVGLGGARLHDAGWTRSLLGGVYNFSAAAMVKGWIEANDTPTTVYHLHGWAQILSPAVFSALSGVHDRLVLSAHDFFLACPNGSFALLKTGEVCPHVPMTVQCITTPCDRRNNAHKLWRVVRHALLGQVYDRRHSPPVLAIHEAMRPFLMRAGIPDSAIEAVPNPVTPYSSTRITAEHNREALFIGRLETTKGPDLAAAACRAAGVTLRLIGDGQLRAELERQYPEMIFMGHQSPVAIRAAVNGGRMLLMPSRYPEPFGLVAAEALLSGLPVLAAETAFLATDIVACGSGMAIDPRHVDSFATAIRRLADSDALALAMSQAAFEQTRNVALTPEAWMDRLLDAYARRLATAMPSQDRSFGGVPGTMISA